MYFLDYAMDMINTNQYQLIMYLQYSNWLYRDDGNDAFDILRFKKYNFVCSKFSNSCMRNCPLLKENYTTFQSQLRILLKSPYSEKCYLITLGLHSDLIK